MQLFGEMLGKEIASNTIEAIPAIVVANVAVDFAKEHHCYKVILQSGIARTKAHQLYENKGFNGASKKAFDMRLE